jgi:hypothetical protein
MTDWFDFMVLNVTFNNISVISWKSVLWPVAPLYTDYKNMDYSLMGKMRLSFIDSDLLYRGVLYRK